MRRTPIVVVALLALVGTSASSSWCAHSRRHQAARRWSGPSARSAPTARSPSTRCRWPTPRRSPRSASAAACPSRPWWSRSPPRCRSRKLENLEDGDRDSIGLFQQRPSQGWGTPEKIKDPRYAADKFYTALKKVKGWQKMRVTDAAQRVQRSAYPNAYQKWADESAVLARALTGRATGAVACTVTGAPVLRGRGRGGRPDDRPAARLGQGPGQAAAADQAAG